MQSRFILITSVFALLGAAGCGDSGTTGTSTTGGGGSTASATSDASSGAGGGATSSASSGAGGGSTSSASSGAGGGATSSSASSSSSSGAGGGAVACIWAPVDPCGVGMYCAAPSCAAGTCVPVGAAETSENMPVCGCDMVTYWNASVAKKHGMASTTNGACPAPKICGGFGGALCPAGASCNMHGMDSSICQIADGGGDCWVVPTKCTVQPGPTTRACGAAACTDPCDLIKNGAPWYTDNTCP